MKLKNTNKRKFLKSKRTWNHCKRMCSAHTLHYCCWFFFLRHSLNIHPENTYWELDMFQKQQQALETQKEQPEPLEELTPWVHHFLSWLFRFPIWKRFINPWYLPMPKKMHENMSSVEGLQIIKISETPRKEKTNKQTIFSFSHLGGRCRHSHHRLTLSS